jgi:O-antigen ligase/tetratricopeptide (TPR) repeat protein
MVSLLVPVIVGSGFFFPYVVPRNLFFRAVVEIGITLVVLALCFGRKSLDLHDEPIFWSLVAFLAAATLSAFFSPARTHSFFGDFERMGGVWAWLHLVLFFLLLRTLLDENWAWILNASLAVSLFVSFGAIAQYSQVLSSVRSPIHLIASSTSTLGNSGLLAAYLLMNIAIAGYLATTSVRYRLLYLSIAGVNLLALVYAANRSAILGLLLGSMVGGVIYATLNVQSRRKWIALSVAALLTLVIATVTVGIRKFPSSAVNRFAPAVLQRLASTNPAGSDESRTMQWRAAVEGFRDRPLLGYGLENHNLVWGAHFDPGIYKIDTDIFDRTHNQYLEVLATTGLVGATAFLAIWIAIGVTLVRAYRAGRLSAAGVAVLAGLQVAYAAYLFFWFVDINSTMLWILIAALIASRGTVGPVVLETTGHDANEPSPKPMLAAASILLLAFALYEEGYTPLRANRALAEIESPSDPLGQSLQQLDLLSRSSARQTAHTPMVMAQFIGSLRPNREALRVDVAQRRLYDRAFADVFATFAREIHRDTLNDRLYHHEGGVLMAAARFYRAPSYEQQAVDAFHKAIDLSPRRVEARLSLANVYIADRDYERAVVVLNDAVKADPQIGELRYRLAEAYLGAGQNDSAIAMLQSSLGLGFVGAPETYLSVGKHLEFSGRGSTAAKLYSDYLEAKYTEAVWDRSEKIEIERPVPSTDLAVAAHLPLLYMRARESELAIKTAAALSAFDPSRSTIVDRFVLDVGSRRRANWVARNTLLPCNAARAARARDSIVVSACGVFRRKL